MVTTQPSAVVLEELRGVLEEKFGEAHRSRPRETVVWGAEVLDRAAIPRGALCEVTLAPGASPAAGAVVIGQILRHGLKQRRRLVLVDGCDAFDASVLPVFGDESASDAGAGSVDLDGSFLWARCRGMRDVVPVADVLLRDANLPRVVIDLQGLSMREIRAVPPSNWLRFRALVEQSGTSCLVFTPAPLLRCAAVRVELNGRFTLDDLDSPEAVWIDRMD